MSQEAIKVAKERVDSAFWGFFPTPSVDVSSRDSDRYTTTARLDQPIWTGGKLMSKYDMANSQEQENFFALQENSYTLIENFLSILESYMQAQSNIEQLQVFNLTYAHFKRDSDTIYVNKNESNIFASVTYNFGW